MSGCGVPADQEILSGLVEGGSVRYQCQPGYRLTGSSVITFMALVTNLEYQINVDYRYTD